MANKFKYNQTGTESNSLFKGNWAIDVSDANTGGGPSSTTGFYNGAQIPVGGYAIYYNNTVFTATNDTQLLEYINTIGGDSSSLEVALEWAANEPSIFVQERQFENIVTDELKMYIDPSSVSSVHLGSPTAYDLSGNGFHGQFRNSDGAITPLGAMEENLQYDLEEGVPTLNFVGYGNSAQGYLEWNQHPLAGYSQYTMDAWFKTVKTSPSEQYNVLWYSSAPSSSFQEFGLITQASQSDPDVGFEIDNNWTGGSSNVRLGLGWHHIAHTYDSDYSNMYIDGVLRYRVNHPNNNVLPSTGWNWIGVGQWANSGYNGGHGYTEGKLGPLRLYGKCLSADEILQNYTAQKDRFPV